MFTSNNCQKSYNALFTAFDRVPFYIKNWAQSFPNKLDFKTCEREIDSCYDALPVLTPKDIHLFGLSEFISMEKDLRCGLANGEISPVYLEHKACVFRNLDWHRRLDNAILALIAQETQSMNRRARLFCLEQSGRANLDCVLSCPPLCTLTQEQRTVRESNNSNQEILFLNEKGSLTQWTPEHMARMVHELNEYTPYILESDPVCLARLAWWTLDNEVNITASPRVILLKFALPSKLELNAIKTVFPTSEIVILTGNSATGIALATKLTGNTIESGITFQTTDFCRVDFANFSKPATSELSRVLVTTFDDPWNCLVKFDIGELVSFYKQILPEGRVDELTSTMGGQPVTVRKLDERMALVPQLREYHVTQEFMGDYNYTVQATLALDGDPRGARGAIQDAMQDLYGGKAKFDINFSSDIVLEYSLATGRRFQRSCKY